ncbi:sulfotransferase domain-containing protein [Rhizorhabdus sp. FW153]|uniref:sulfotransferase domain-containing protein n=1 Tax=Rhizorhabdus sp. FW153 TaxID=3400216 RepID=UPI003CE733FE
MADFPAGLVWLASYPKSGNTWMRILLANLLAGAERPADINNLAEPETLVSQWRFADDMLVDPDLLDKRELERLRPLQCDFAAMNVSRPFFCKTHDRFWMKTGEPTLGTSARRALYIVRDPRDVAISLSYHSSLTIDAAIAQMMDPKAHSAGRVQLPYAVGDWGCHVMSWTTQRVVETKVVRYEDLHADTIGTLSGIVDFVGGQASQEEIRRAVSHSSFEELQRQEASKGFRESRPGQQRFFRAGRVADWRETLTPQQAHTIENHFADVMSMHGYVGST